MTRQFDVVANPDQDDAIYRPFLVVLQSDLVSGLRSTVVAPLIPKHEMLGARQLTPLVMVEGREHWVATYELFAVEQHMLGPRRGTLAEHRDVIVAALDLLFIGF